jgi:hypothetical protein
MQTYMFLTETEGHTRRVGPKHRDGEHGRSNAETDRTGTIEFLGPRAAMNERGETAASGLRAPTNHHAYSLEEFQTSQAMSMSKEESSLRRSPFTLVIEHHR